MKNAYGYVGAVVVGLILAGGLAVQAAAQTKTAAPAKAAPPAKAAAKSAARVVKISADDTLKYDVTTINAKPGEALEIELTSKSALPKQAMAHNFVLLKKTTDLNAFVMEAAMSQATGYIPAKYKAEVIASTPMAGPGETVKATFKAPTVPGSYTYLCSFAGHFLAGMKGTLVVK